jgi:hypothetical protein
VVLSAPVNATLGLATNTVTIQDDDVPIISVGNPSIVEGNAGQQTLEFPVDLSAAPLSPVSVNWQTLNGTAVAGSDYLGGSGTLTIGIGETQGFIRVDVLRDLLVDPGLLQRMRGLGRAQPLDRHDLAPVEGSGGALAGAPPVAATALSSNPARS